MKKAKTCVTSERTADENEKQTATNSHEGLPEVVCAHLRESCSAVDCMLCYTRLSESLSFQKGIEKVFVASNFELAMLSGIASRHFNCSFSFTLSISC